MLAEERAPALQLAVRMAAPLAWRNEARTAQKLLGFAATEAGSALDMLKAAELERDPRLRRLFFVHATDEARHAEMFARAARARGGPVALSVYQQAHAVRQNLYQQLGRTAFLAFCARAEKKGQQHFAALARHFQGDVTLSALFERIEKDERFHVRYAEKELERLAARDPRAVQKARAKVRLQDAWRAWRRAGRRLGDLVARAVLAVFFFVALPVFALLQRALDPEQTGWHARPREPLTLDDMKSQF